MKSTFIRRSMKTTAMLLTIAILLTTSCSCNGSSKIKNFGLGTKSDNSETTKSSSNTAEKISDIPLVDNEGHSPFVAVVKKVVPAVVFIKVTGVETVKTMFPQMPNFRFNPFSDPFGDDDFQMFTPREMQRVVKGQGSGFIIDKDGYIITNNHVIDKAKQITVTLSDKKTYEARIIGQDPLTDLALIKIDAKGTDLPFIQLGDSDKIEVGDWSIAVGNPMGLENTVTVGIISAKGRSHLGLGNSGPIYQSFIQTDTPINIGNSGGPLVNIKGEVIGINSAINAMGQNLGFAIPINMAKSIMKQLREKGKVTRGYIGVNITDLTPQIAQGMGSSVKEGVLINSVTSGGPAEKAGLMRGDIITEVDGKPIKDANSLMIYIGDAGSDGQVELTYYRADKQNKIKIKLAQRPDDLGDVRSQAERGKDIKPKDDVFGIKVVDLNHPSLGNYQFPVKSGVVVIGVDQTSSASGVLNRGDVIVEINKTPVNNASDFKRKIEELSKKKTSIVMYIYRQNTGLYISFTP